MNAKKCDKVVFSLVSVTLVMCVVMLMFFSMSFKTNAVSANRLKTIDSLNLRSSASDNASVITVIPKNSEVTLLENSTNGWARIKYSTYTGYSSADYLNVPTGSAVTMKAKTTSEVNLRSGMGTSYSSLGYVPDGTIVVVTSNADEDWAKVNYSGKSGYIKKDYLVITFTLSSNVTENTTSTTKPDNSDFNYPAPDLSNLPCWYNNSLTDSMLGGNSSSFSGFMISESKLSLDINETHKLNAFVTGAIPIVENVSFTSDNPKIAKVSENGLVTGMAKGTATISATDKATGNIVKCSVTVSDNYAPTEPETQKPTQTEPATKPTETVAPSTQVPTTPTTPTVPNETLSLSQTKVSLYVGNECILKATSNVAVTWSTSNSSVAIVSDGLVVAKSEGTATITAKTSKKSVSCTVTVKKATTSVSISHRSATVTAGKTFLAYSSTSSVSWSSSDTSVATVSNGYIYGVAPGKAVITVSKTGGASTMVVTVTNPAPIRFAYTSPNCATKNGQVTLIAITDNKRSAVKFDVTVGSSTKTVEATSKTADGKNYIWKGTTSFSSAGTYSVKAYSKLNASSSWSTCSDASTTAFVTATTDKNTTICANRRASDEIINLIANYEGFISSVYADPLTGDPTLGYGRVVYSGQQFYNNLTKTEAYAYLVQTVNNDGYATKVNSFLVNNSVKYNQQQFDALVCFVYNTGTGVLSNDGELKSALLNCSSGSSTTQTSYYINGSAVRIRKGPGTNYDIIKELDYGTQLKILEKTTSSWYYVQLNDGTKGYVITDYIASKVSSGSLDLNFVNKQNLINKFCQYHHANGCVYGLLYRRVDEMEVFFYNDYSRNYGNYQYDIKFTCANNSNFHT